MEDDGLTNALGQLKEIIRANVSDDMIATHAFRLIGEPQDTIDRETRELFEALRRQSQPLPRNVASGLSFALRELVRDRIREIEGYAS
jgi:hypothetical protein